MPDAKQNFSTVLERVILVELLERNKMERQKLSRLAVIRSGIFLRY